MPTIRSTKLVEATYMFMFYFPKINSSITLGIPHGFLDKNCACISCFSPACYLFSPS